MRVAFDGHRLAGQRLGVGRYLEYLLRHWGQALGPGEVVDLYLRKPLDAASLATLTGSPAIRPRVLKPEISGIPWENVALRWPAARADVLFCPAYTAPVAYGGPLVVATHSANEVHAGAHGARYARTYGRLHRHCARQADVVIVPSEGTARDVSRLYGVPPERIVAIAQGADDAFAPMDDPAALRAVRVRFFGADRPFVLFVGKASARRNIPLLLRAFALVTREHDLPHGLLLFGPNVTGLPLERLCRELGIAGDVVQTDGVLTEHADVVEVYNAADVFVHPSEYEGWSMTAVEALACGTAVVAANRGGLAEAVAGHGVLLDDLTPEAFAHALGEVLTRPEHRRELERSARQRGAALRWEETTSRTLDVVREVAGRAPTRGRRPWRR